MNLRGWPTGMRAIVRKERPHPGAQLRLTDPDGHRYTAFATNTRPGGSHRQLADLELRHRRRARAEDRIRAAKDTGLRNLPVARAAQPELDLAGRRRSWPARSLPGPTSHLTDHPARRWEPKRLRLRIFSLPAQAARHARRALLHLPAHAPWAGLLLDGLTRLRALAVPSSTPPRPSRRTQEPDRTRGTGAPAISSRTVIPNRQNALTTPASTGADQASIVRRKIQLVLLCTAPMNQRKAMQARSQDRRVRPVAEQAPDPRPRGRGRARGRVAPAAATALLRRHRSRHRRGPARRVDAGAAATPPRRPPKGPPPHQSTSTDANLCLARRRHRRRSTPSSTGSAHRFSRSCRSSSACPR